MISDNRSKGIFEEFVHDTQSAALLLAMSDSLRLEETVKDFCREKGYRYAVTEWGGEGESFKRNVVKTIIGSALHNGIIDKDSCSGHALLHATEEAAANIGLNGALSRQIAVKIAIVRHERWITVAIYGNFAIYYLTNHKRVGMGTMHI